MSSSEHTNTGPDGPATAVESELGTDDSRFLGRRAALHRGVAIVGVAAAAVAVSSSAAAAAAPAAAAPARGRGAGPAECLADMQGA